MSTSHAADPSEPAIGAESETPVPVPRRRRRRLLRFGLAAGVCLVASLAGGVGIQLGASPPEDKVADPPDAASASHALPHDPEPSTEAERIDRFIRSGNFDRALQHCRAAADERHRLDYREALCLEGLGRWQEAMELYGRAAEAQGNPRTWAWAVVGQARCAAATGDIERADGLLAQIARRPGDAEKFGRDAIEDCLYLNARLRVVYVRPAAPPDPLDASALAWPSIDGRIDQFLDRLVDGLSDASLDGHTKPIPAIDIQRPPRDATRAARCESAAVALRKAIDAASDHPAVGSARIWLANLDVKAGRLRVAVTTYQAILERTPLARESRDAAYNLGLLGLRHANWGVARARFLDVIDRAPGSRWADLGWWWIGRSHLDSGDNASAVRAFRAAMAGDAKDVASAATLGTAVAQLLDGDNAGARSTLRDHRITSERSHIVTEALLEAIVRYRMAPSDGRQSILEAALENAREGPVLGSAGTLLAGQAYRDIEKPDTMAEMYDAAVETARGPLAIRMTFTVAERLLERDDRSGARQRFLAVAAADPEGLGPKAELRIADLAARDGKGLDCIQRCRALIGRPNVDMSELLSVLGRGYELEKQYGQAAEAFAGRIPAE
jgi:tetratricopeptide (TPR) repeat protein